MIVKKQKPIIFDNKCGAIFIPWQLEAAILWKNQLNGPVCRIKRVFMHGRYPAISIHGRKIHIHRLIMSWMLKRTIQPDIHVHHKNENTTDATGNNLEIKDCFHHLSMHHKGKKQTEDHKRKRINSCCMTRYGHLAYPIFEGGE